jgi:type III pantothenate kinase
MSLLAVAIGNTYTTLGLLDGDRVGAHWRVGTETRRTPDEWAVLVRGLLAEVPEAVVDGIAVCAAVPSVQRAWREMLANAFAGLPAVVIEPGVRTGVPVRTDNPREVGADRIMNAVAVVEKFGGPAVVVDFGTATTFDVVDDRGQYVGGAISAGIELSLEALGSRAAQLRQVELRRPSRVIAKNTVEAMQSGIVFGVASQVDGMVARILAELEQSGVDPRRVPVVSTGHSAHLVAGECGCFTHDEPFLTLLGLGVVFGRNAR